MSQQAVETVKRLFEIVAQPPDARHNRVLELYHPEIVIHEAPSLPYGGDYYGHDGARRHGSGFNRTWDVFQQAPAARGLDPIFLESGTLNRRVPSVRYSGSRGITAHPPARRFTRLFL